MKGKGFVVWLTGRPASGKSTIARHVADALRPRGVPVEVLDGDEIRSMLSPDLKWDLNDRDVNTRRLAWIGALLARHGVAVLIPAVASRRHFRDRARAMTERFAEVYADAPLAVARKRDPKGLYARADRGEVRDIAGLHQPYEPPLAPEVYCRTHEEHPAESAAKVLAFLEDAGWVPGAWTPPSIHDPARTHK